MENHNANEYDASQIQILDVMKTMDNRIPIDEATLKQYRSDPRSAKTLEKFRAVKSIIASRQRSDLQ